MGMKVIQSILLSLRYCTQFLAVVVSHTKTLSACPPSHTLIQVLNRQCSGLHRSTTRPLAPLLLQHSSELTRFNLSSLQSFCFNAFQAPTSSRSRCFSAHDLSNTHLFVFSSLSSLLTSLSLSTTLAFNSLSTLHTAFAFALISLTLSCQPL